VRSADKDLLVFTRAKENSPKARALRRAGVEIVHLPGRASKPNLDEAVTELGRREILSVLLEAGPHLNAAALSAGLVHKLVLFYAPKLAGHTAVPFVSALSSSIHTLILRSIQQFGPDVALELVLGDHKM